MFYAPGGWIASAMYMYHDLACACRWNIGSCAARSLWLKSPGGSSVDQSRWPA